MSESKIGRRGFIGRVAGVVAAATAVTPKAEASQPAPAEAGITPPDSGRPLVYEQSYFQNGAWVYQSFNAMTGEPIGSPRYGTQAEVQPHHLIERKAIERVTGKMRLSRSQRRRVKKLTP